MLRRATVFSGTGFFVFLSALAPALAAQPAAKASGDDAGQIKAVQEERIKVLAQLVDVLSSQYRMGLAGAAEMFSAERELCNAMLESTDDPEKRVALLTKQAEKAGELLKIMQGLVKSGTATQADILRAKSLYLDIRLKLLREQSRKKLSKEEKRVRPLDGGMTVDRYGVIWADGKPVGIWGVDIESEPAR